MMEVPGYVACRGLPSVLEIETVGSAILLAVEYLLNEVTSARVVKRI